MLRIVYVVGWLPALIGAYLVVEAVGDQGVVSAAGAAGAAAGAALAVTLAILGAGYVRALAQPQSAKAILAAAAGSLAAALALPFVFSADIYAYAYYGDLALRGANPYGHALPAQADALTLAAVRAWGGHVPPRCVYGPVAVAIAALADLAGAAGSAAGQIFAQRIAAVVAYAAYTVMTIKLVPDARARAAALLHPTVIWSVSEGHNDAAMLALIAAGFATNGLRPLHFALAALVKAPAIAVFWQIGSRRARVAAAAVTGVGYLPLALALAGAPPSGAAPAAAWQSPLGLLAAAVGRFPALAIDVVWLAVCAAAVFRLDRSDRLVAFACAAWIALPNAYPWYALWIVPFAARNVSSLWSRTLLVAAGFAPARALLDAMYPAADRVSASAAVFHLPLIALEYLPPLIVLGVGTRWVRRAAALMAIGAFLSAAQPAAAQSAQPSPVPATAPVTTTPAAGPMPNPTPTPPPGSAITPTPTPGAPAGAPVSPSASLPPLSPPPLMPSPAPAASAPPNAPPPVKTVPPVAVPTVNPFGYIITPPAAPVSPNGPHILEVELNDRRIHAGGPLIVRVITSANVVGVEARALGRFIAIPQSSPGLFALAYTLPDGIPFWLLNRNYNVVIAAATADGRQTSVSFPMLLTR